MKKYVKPELFYESFELSQQIAACEFDANNLTSTNTCNFVGTSPLGNPIFILQTEAVCSTPEQIYCYHGSTGGSNIFNS